MSTIVRNMLALGLLASAAHAQSTPLSIHEAPSDHARRIQPPSTRAQGYQDVRSTFEDDDSVRPASFAETASSNTIDAPLPLRANASRQRLEPESPRSNSGQRATATVLFSLSVVLAAFFLLVWLSRKTAPKGLAPLPGEVFESLGRAPLTARQQMQLIRLGNKLVLLSVTSTGAETLTEITETDEVNRLAGLCQQGRSGSISDTFRQVLSQYADEPAPGGFIGDPSVSQADVASRTNRRERRREDNRG